MTKNKEPMFRVVKRSDASRIRIFVMYLAMIFVALAIGAVLLSILHVSPFKFYKDMFTIGIVGNRFAYKNVEGFITVFVPLLITSVALSLSFKMRFWNIGGEGQFIMGALSASYIAIIFGGKLSTPIVLILMFAFSMLVSGIYGSIIAVLKVKFGTNETLLTLMFNYIALYFLKFWGENKGTWNLFLEVDSERPLFKTFEENTWMPGIAMVKFTLNISLILAIILCIVLYIYLTRTKHGYEISVIGDSPNTANYAGMKTNRIVIRTMFLSACLIGFAGACNISTAHTLSTSVTNNVGWTGIIVAWLSKLNIIGVFITSVLISILQYGCKIAGSEFSSIDANFANLLQGIILFCVLVADFTTRFKIVIKKSNKEGENNE